jgi:hypothetical protein
LWFVEDTGVDGVWYRVVDQFGKDQAILAFIEELHSISGNRVSACNIWIVFDDLQRMSVQ